MPYLFQTNLKHRNKRRTISIFVMGDLCHSPRICYHALSFSSIDYNVNLCGYVESEPPYEIIDDINIDIIPIKVLKNKKNLPFIVFAGFKMFIQIIQIWKIMWKTRKEVDYVLIQNPPCIPILLIILIFKYTINNQLKIIIDWHNLNYTILNLRYQNLNNPFVVIVRKYEEILGKFANLNITVTKQMKKFLVEQFCFNKSKVVTLYDRPGKQFQPIAVTDRNYNHEVFTDMNDLPERKILVSSTSFTPDEDFNLLLNALKKYEADSETPPIYLIVTGKGPMKEEFLKTVDKLSFSSKVIISTSWLSSEDYPKILATADLGVSLHTSSSGIDLPMKIVDFFGSGIPVVSLNFPAISELVKDEVNGLVVKKSSSNELFRAIKSVFTNDELLRTLKDGALNESKSRWDENWARVLKPKFGNKQ
ncbi:ALG1 [Candida pseudojiufengensis]|uniref:ALG1 n=1 Tax=Candida pseudojiufengensis TaxID=497109 RepID=UPI002225104C|nr:ALG1 [Candida pseudojiufengensis]KAI5965816.1 ALG1 [Candida pseudojiufengensis]